MLWGELRFIASRHRAANGWDSLRKFSMISGTELERKHLSISCCWLTALPSIWVVELPI